MTLNPDSGYKTGTVEYYGLDSREFVTITPENGIYSFKMPNESIVICAEFKEDILLGDVNFDGFVNDEDAALVLKYISTDIDFNPDDPASNAKAEKAADIFADDKINMLDVIKIQQTAENNNA